MTTTPALDRIAELEGELEALRDLAVIGAAFKRLRPHPSYATALVVDLNPDVMQVLTTAADVYRHLAGVAQ